MLDTWIGFGASTMQGVGDSQGGWFARAERMAEANGIRARWINRGIGGNTTRDMLKRISTVTVHSPYRLAIILGCNDMSRGPNDNRPDARTTLDEYGRNLDELLLRLRGTSSLFISSFPVAPKVGIAPANFHAHMETAMTSAKRHGYEVWDLYHELLDRAEPFWAPDGVHFNDAGHQYIAENFLKRLGKTAAVKA